MSLIIKLAAKSPTIACVRLSQIAFSRREWLLRWTKTSPNMHVVANNRLSNSWLFVNSCICIYLAVRRVFYTILTLIQRERSLFSGVSCNRAIAHCVLWTVNGSCCVYTAQSIVNINKYANMTLTYPRLACDVESSEMRSVAVQCGIGSVLISEKLVYYSTTLRFIT